MKTSAICRKIYLVSTFFKSSDAWILQMSEKKRWKKKTLWKEKGGKIYRLVDSRKKWGEISNKHNLKINFPFIMSANENTTLYFSFIKFGALDFLWNLINCFGFCRCFLGNAEWTFLQFSEVSDFWTLEFTKSTFWTQEFNFEL